MLLKEVTEIIKEEIIKEFQLNKSILEKVDEFGELFYCDWTALNPYNKPQMPNTIGIWGCWIQW